ncbi:hypothetical protein RI129_010766 [Pyrocoelia pectoralis]|uniref:UDP-glucuronosyltransferase n=1 Tax=Pyrocoelia pectoralis TaxID=417401 RepID=A0AAN7UZF6_9COLE
MYLVTTLLLVFLSESCECARILGVIPTPSYSHQVVFQPLWKELSLRGHQVTVLTTNTINDPTLTNLTEIDLSFSYKFLEENLVEIINSSQSILKVIDLTLSSFANVVDAQLQHPKVEKLIRDPNEHFDLLIAEYSMAAILYLSRRFNCPYIGVLSMELNNAMYSLVGAPGHPIVYPDPFLQIYGKPNLFQRIYLVLMELSYNFVNIPGYQEKVAKKHFGYDTPIQAVIENASLLFINTDPIFHPVRPLPPNVIPIGGNVARIPVKPLQEGLKNFLDEAVDGFIYFSLGSNVKSKDIPTHTMEVILETFKELPYKVLWKYELNDLPNKPGNVIISKWVSQMEVLNHLNLKLFITHGGAQSMEEAILARVPIVGMPFFVDQPFNVQKMVHMGFALSVDYREMTKEEFKGAILEVISNDKYRNRIREYATLVDDQPMTGLERAVWWTEYVIRHKGAGHFRSPSLDMPWYQYHFWDVITVLFLVSSLLVIVMVVITKCVLSILSRVLLGYFKKKKQ